MTSCEHVGEDLAELVAGDPDTVARHADHLASCDDCRDARHEATQLALRVAIAGSDHAPAPDLAERMLALIDARTGRAPTASEEPTAIAARPVADDASDDETAVVRRDAADQATVVAPALRTTSPGMGAVSPADPALRPTPAVAKMSNDAGMWKLAGLPAAEPAVVEKPQPKPRPVVPMRAPKRRRVWLAAGAAAALAAGGAIYVATSTNETTTPVAEAPASGAKLTKIERAAKDAGDGVTVREGSGWRALKKDEVIPAGAELRTDEHTRAAITLADGTKLVLDYKTTLAFAPSDARKLQLTAGRLAADVIHVDGHPAAIATPNGTIDVVGTRFSVTATESLTAVQVTRGSVVLSNKRGEHDDVHAGEEGTIERGALTVAAAPALARDAAWSELGAPKQADQVASGIGALRAYKPGESRDRDWNLALAKHDVKVRIVGPIARTEITETFRNDSATTLEGVYQFPLPADAQIDGLSLDEPGKAGSFIAGAFVDKERGAKIWRGVIDKATPKMVQRPAQEIIWVEGRWRDPALLDWKRGGRFELKIYPIPAKGARTIKIAYTQVVTPRGPWRQYVYPLPHSQDGSTVADQFTADVEVRGAAPGLTRAAGYDLVADPARKDVSALTLSQSGFVPRGDLVVEYRATDGDAELRAWTYAGGAAVAPDEKLAKKKNVGIDPKVIDAQRVVAADMRPTAVVALHPKLPRWQESKPHDYAIVVDASQSMVGERFARAAELASAIVDQMDRRDRFTVLACDSECKKLGDLRTPSPKTSAEAKQWLAAQSPAGASDVVASVRSASEAFSLGDRDAWILYIGDGNATTGFRRVADVERAVHESQNARLTTIGIGTDADATLLQAAARGGGGSYVAWVPGEHVATAAASALETSYGNMLRDVTVELPAGMADIAPTVLPTIRGGDEVLLGARITGDVAGDVVLRGSVAGQPFQQRYPVKLAVSTAAGNAFVPRLWASLAIDQLERDGTHEDRAKIVALSQGYGVMSRETSLLALESQAMFDAFGVDRGQPQATWTGDEQIDEVAGSGTMALDEGDASKPAPSAGGAKADAKFEKSADKTVAATTTPALPDPAPAPPAETPKKKMPPAPKPAAVAAHERRAGIHISQKMMENPLADDGPGADWIQLRRIWVRVPSVGTYDAVAPSLTKVIAADEAELAAHPDSREKHRALVQALAYAGELDRAKDVAKKWLDRDQLDPQALGYLADIYGRSGDRELGLRTLAGLVDLDADNVALHDRMAKAYEQVGRLSQACAHRIAIASIQPKNATSSAAALRCLRGLGKNQDAELIVRALPDDATRAQVEKAALVTPVAAPVTGDLVVKAHWDNNADVDLTLLAPDGSRVSWMGGRTDVATGDVTSSDHESLAVKYLRRGNYLVEISRAGTSKTPVHGTIEITALGAKKSIPFELTGDRKVVGRVSVSLKETFEDLDGNPVILYNSPDRRIIRATEIR